MEQIVVKNLCKSFKVSKRQPGFWNALKGVVKRDYTEIPALKNVSFTIDQGELVGYIGLLYHFFRNGCKKLLSYCRLVV